MTITAMAARCPLAGNIDATLGDDTLQLLDGFFAQYGDAFRVHSSLLDKDLYVLSHPDHVRHVLVDHPANFAKGIGIERVAILLGNGLMTSDGPLWRSQRKAIQPAFHRNAVQAHTADLVAANVAFVNRLLANPGTSVDMTHALSALTLEIVLRTLFGKSFERIAGSDSPFALLTAETDRDLKFAYAFRQLGTLVQREIERRRDVGEENADILQTLMDARDRHHGGPMSDRQIRDEVFTLIVAGHETTASALAWTWYLIARHPQVADRIHAEVDSASDAECLRPDAQRFAYLQQVIRESLRLYPPGWLLTRRARTATSIAGIDVAEGDEILISPYLVHRHPQMWPDPEIFDPDRFRPEIASKRSRFCYLPFGLGPRACIGEPLACAEMLVHLVTVARSCTVKLVAGQVVNMEAKVNLRPRPAIHMNILPRLNS